MKLSRQGCSHFSFSQNDFSSLHHIPLKFQLDFFRWIVTEICQASSAARAKIWVFFWACCTLLHDFSGEPVVGSDNPGTSGTDISDSEFEVAAPTSNEDVGKKKRVLNSPLTAVVGSWFLFILPCRVIFRAVANFLMLQVMPILLWEFPETRTCWLVWRLMVSWGDVT